MGNPEVSRRLTEQVQETLRAANNTSATILSDLLEQVGGIQELNGNQRNSLVVTLRQIHQDQRTDVTDEVRNNARDLAVLVDREKFIQEFADTPVPESKFKKWTKRAIGLTAAVVAGGAAATWMGPEGLAAVAEGIGSAAKWVWGFAPSGTSVLDVVTHPATAYGVAGATLVGAYGISKLQEKKKEVPAAAASPTLAPAPAPTPASAQEVPLPEPIYKPKHLQRAQDNAKNEGFTLIQEPNIFINNGTRVRVIGIKSDPEHTCYYVASDARGKITQWVRCPLRLIQPVDTQAKAIVTAAGRNSSGSQSRRDVQPEFSI